MYASAARVGPGVSVGEHRRHRRGVVVETTGRVTLPHRHRARMASRRAGYAYRTAVRLTNARLQTIKWPPTPGAILHVSRGGYFTASLTHLLTAVGSTSR